MSNQDAVRVISPSQWGPPMDIVRGGATCRAIVWPGNGGYERSLHYFAMPQGSSTVELVHRSEAVYYVAEGSVLVSDLTDAKSREVGVGGMFHIEIGTQYLFVAEQENTVVLGGPCPADIALYEALSGNAKG
jgi:mannose-6-phosphate isomerase-like protein (cupin superfamily)